MDYTYHVEMHSVQFGMYIGRQPVADIVRFFTFCALSLWGLIRNVFVLTKLQHFIKTESHYLFLWGLNCYICCCEDRIAAFVFVRTEMQSLFFLRTELQHLFLWGLKCNICFQDQ